MQGEKEKNSEHKNSCKKENGVVRYITKVLTNYHSTKDQNRGLVRDVRAQLRNCIFGITPGRDGM